MKGGLNNPRVVDALPVNANLNNAISSDWAYDHAADLDAHTRHFLEIFVIGEYLQFLPAGGSGIAVTTNLLRAEIFYVPRDMTFDRIAIKVQTLEAAPNDGIVLGIYNSHATTLYPTSLIASSGGEVSTAATGTKTVTINISLTKGIYYLAHHHESNVRKIQGKTTNIEVCTPFGGYVTGDLPQYFCCGFSDEVTAYAGALPAIFPAAGGRLYYPMTIGLRVASLD